MAWVGCALNSAHFFSIFLPFEGMPASLGPRLRTVSGANGGAVESCHRVPIGAIAGEFPPESKSQARHRDRQGSVDGSVGDRQPNGLQRPRRGMPKTGVFSWSVRQCRHRPRTLANAAADARCAGRFPVIRRVLRWRSIQAFPGRWHRAPCLARAGERFGTAVSRDEKAPESGGILDTRSCIRGVYALTTSAILALRKNDVSDQFRTWQSGTKGLKKLPLCATFQVKNTRGRFEPPILVK